MHAVRPGDRPGAAGQNATTGAATRRPTSRRRPTPRRGRAKAAEPVLAPEVEEPAGAGAGGGGATRARDQGRAFGQELRVAMPINRISRALAVTVVVPGEGMVNSETPQNVRPTVPVDRSGFNKKFKCLKRKKKNSKVE
jgi:hypothetical protein